MKNFLSIAFLFVVGIFAASTVSAQTNRVNHSPNSQSYHQTKVKKQIKKNNKTWVETKTRIIKKGKHTYRQTIQIKHLRNGKTQTKVIKTVRIR